MTSHWSADREVGPGAQELQDIASLLGQDQVVILPTDTLYGFHGRALSEVASGVISDLKGRDDQKPYVVLCAGIGDLEVLGVRAGSDAIACLSTIWPAPLTAILPLDAPIPASRGKCTLAIRIPMLPWLRLLIGSTGPLISTSVNRSGQPEARDVAGLNGDMTAQVSGIVDSGLISGLPSTIVDFTGWPPRVVREGAFTFAQDLWKKTRKTL